MNEVIGVFLELLLQQEFIRDNYYVSTVPADVRSYCSIVIAKYPFWTTWRGRKIITIFEIDKESAFAVAAFHLVARENHNQQLRRYEELQKANLYFNEFLSTKNSEKASILMKKAVGDNNIMILGDMNFHNLCETDIIYELEYEDVWLNIKQLTDVGYTWDPAKNSFINLLLPLDNRRMRLDRIMIKKNSSHIEYKSIEIFATESIGISRMGKKITPSDHYGLSAEFLVKSSSLFTEVDLLGKTHQSNDMKNNQATACGPSFDYWDNRSSIISGRNAQSTGFSSLRTIIIKRVACLAFIGIFTIAAIVVGVFLIVR